MYLKNKKKVIKVAVKYMIELPEDTSDKEVDKHLAEIFPCKEIQWCDGDQDIFGDF